MNKYILLAALCTFTAVMPCISEVLIDADFSRAGEIKKELVNNTKRCKGKLPAGWRDNSSFAPVWVEYSFGDEQGTRFQRTRVTKIEKDWAQLSIAPLPDAKQSCLYRLSITCRNRMEKSITVGLRHISKPYTYYWKKLSSFSPNWKTYKWEFDLPKNDVPMGLWISNFATGTFDIAALKLERLSPLELKNAITRKYPEGGPANLVRVSRFPLGLPSGWSIGRNSSDGDVVVVQPAENAFTPATKITAPEHLTISSAPVELKYPIVKHTASISIRGNGEWLMRTGGQGIHRSSKKITATDSWQRIAVPFNTNQRNRFCQVFIEGQGTLYIDKFQVGPANKYKGRYQPSMTAEITAALASGFDAGAAGVVFDDETTAFDVATTGDIKDATVHWKLFNLNEKMIKEGSIDAVPHLKITDFSARYGSFRLELKLERNGKPISPTDEVIWNRLHRPRYWGRDAPDSPFAVHTLSTTRHILMAKAMGINWTRLHDAGLEYFGWWNLETEKGKWRFFDRELKRYGEHGIKIFAELGTAPPWASYYQDTGLKTFGYFDKFFQPKNLDDFANYVRVVCNRYKNEIDAFDVWNEPWIKAWWGVSYDHTLKGRAGYQTSEHPMADFVKITKLVRDEVHKIIPHAKVFGVNTTTSGNVDPITTCRGGTQWTKGILAANGIEHCDGIAFHCYTTGGVGYPGDSIETGISNAVGLIRKKYNGTIPKPLWMTEGSPLIYRIGNGLYRHVMPGEKSAELRENANRIARYQISMLANGVTRMFIYSMHSHNGIFSTGQKKWNAFTNDDGSMHPTGAAHAQTAWMLEDTRFRECREIGDGIYAYIFEGKNRAVAAISSMNKFKPLPIPQSEKIKATGLFGNPLPQNAVYEGDVVYLETDNVETLRKALGPR